MGNLYQVVRDWFASGAWVVAGQRLIAAIVIVAVTILIVHLLQLWFDRMRRRAGEGAPLVYIVEKLSSYAVILVGVLASLSALGIDLQSFAVFAGALGVGVGLGLQGIVREFVCGVVLIFDRQVCVGDFVEVQHGGARGEIVEIGARATRLRTNDGFHVVIPNSTMIGENVTNWTYNEGPRRIRVPFSVAEASDKAKVREVVLAAAHALPFAMPDGEGRKTQVWLTGFAGAGLDFELIAWPTLDAARHPASMRAAYIWAIHDALTAAGIRMAADQLEMHLQSLFGREGEAALRTLKLRADEPAARPASPPPVPNDATASVFDEAASGAAAREAERRPREVSAGAAAPRSAR